jgi:hypothetical protein
MATTSRSILDDIDQMLDETTYLMRSNTRYLKKNLRKENVFSGRAEVAHVYRQLLRLEV